MNNPKSFHEFGKEGDNTGIARGKKILLIEDEFYIRDLYRGVLEKAGFHVDIAPDGNEGLKLSQNEPALILLDIMLPGLNGLEVLKVLKSKPETQGIPVVLVTNLGQEDVIREAFTNGAQGYLLKVKLGAQDLIDEVNKYLADPRYKMDINSLYLD